MRKALNGCRKNLFQLLNCFSTQLSQFLVDITGAEGAQQDSFQWCCCQSCIMYRAAASECVTLCSLFDCPLSTGMVDCRFSSGTVCFGDSFYWSSTLELNRLCLAAHVSVVCIWREFFPRDCDSLIRKYWIHLFRSCSVLVYHVKRMRAGLIAAR